MAATDVLTLSAAKRALFGGGSGSQHDDALVGAYVGAVSQRLDRACGPIVQRVTSEAVDGGGWALRLRNAPYASITTVTEWVGGTGRVLTAETVSVAGEFAVDPFHVADPPGLLSGRLYRRSGRWDTGWVCGRASVVVTAVAGRYVSTAAVAGTRFEQAAMILLRHLWQQETLSVASPGEYDVPTPSFPRTMPLIVRQLLSADWQEDLAVA